MGKYLMNKFIHHVNMNESAEKEYKSNPLAFVEKWEKGEKLTPIRHSSTLEIIWDRPAAQWGRRCVP